MAFLGGKDSKVLIHMANVFNRYNDSCFEEYPSIPRDQKNGKKREKITSESNTNSLSILIWKLYHLFHISHVSIQNWNIA